MTFKRESQSPSLNTPRAFAALALEIGAANFAEEPQ
jgi:hypothetical protein